MKQHLFKIKHIPAVRWGRDSEKIMIAVHGKMSHKEDTVIRILAEEAVKKEYQLISFDLPEHGDRMSEKDYPWNIENGLADLEIILDYARGLSDTISLFACSLGAYFSLLAYKNYPFRQVFFLSPIVNMRHLIEGMMDAEKITEEELKERTIIRTSFGEVLDWNYYQYVKMHPVSEWNSETFVLYGKKDQMISETDIRKFCTDFSSNLDILENSEHFFHTEEQLEYFQKWLGKNVV